MRPARLFLCLAIGMTAALASPMRVPAGDTAPEKSLSWRTDLLDQADRAKVAGITAPATDFSKAEPFETLSGGAATSIDPPDRDAFSHLSGNLPAEDEMQFHLGRALFRKLWAASPSSTQASDGLGPLFNARSCESCHQRDGRGRPPGETGDATSFLLRLARPPATPAEASALKARKVLSFPDANYGAQLQDHAITGVPAEGEVHVAYQDKKVELAGGETASLRVPRYSIGKLAYGELEPGTTLSPRISQPMIGLGLIEAIHAGDILAKADPDDSDRDGISGKAAIVLNEVGQETIGRFGWKAQNPSVRLQSATALATDIGISSPLAMYAHGDCTRSQTACLDRPDGVQPRLGNTEAPDPVLDLLTFYTENVAVPARRRASFPEVLAGKEQFYAMGCPACHTPKFVTRRDASIGALGYQLIFPYSDFLLHDMGEGLADGQRVGDASGSEWRTPPLWGIGLTKTVNGNSFYLHDGRARNLTEAILWHAGEATKAQAAFAGASGRDRQALITFLESL